MFSGNMPAWRLQIPPPVALAMTASMSARPIPRPRPLAATFETKPPDYDAFDASHHAEHRLVAVENGHVVGWVALAPTSSRACYAGVAANSVDPEDLARRLLSLGSRWVLVKGGHRAGDPIDVLLGPERLPRAFPGVRVETPHTHGTGCTLASALACRLALGDPVPAAVAAAKEYVTGAIRGGFALGSGIGPTDHLWQLRPYLAP